MDLLLSPASVSTRGTRAAALMLLTICLIACGGNGGGTQPKAPAAVTTSVPMADVFGIAEATIAGNTVTVTGTGFGSKTAAAPLKYEDFDARSTGATPATLGYTNYGGFGGSTTVDAAVGFGGGKSLKHQGDFGPVSGDAVAESFPHIAVRGFSSLELFVSYRLKFRTNGSTIAQLKFNRSAMEDVSANQGGCYGGRPKFYSSYYPDNGRYNTDKTLKWLQGGVLPEAGAADEGWIGETLPGTFSLPIPEDTWVQIEEYYRLNDIGQANGEHVTFVNGNPQFDRHALQARTSASQQLNCSYLVIGMDYWINPTSTNGVTVWYDDHYLDTTRARLVLANAPTWAGSTVRNPQPATQWLGSRIAASLKRGGFAVGAPAWLYVVRADGVVSTGWPVVLN